jgi:sterol desaturase/sphingolipid hydroxylase (fatty acid hydroxylase superfamily)
MLTSAVMWLLLGLPWLAVAVFSAVESFYDYFTHANLRTPHWIGYFLQRPEMHRVHHQHGVHASNYSLPLWDMLFGTHVNPKPGTAIRCGFDERLEARVMEMLAGRDVHSVRERVAEAADGR